MDDALLFTERTTASGMRVYHQYRSVPWFGCYLVVWAGHRHTPVGKEELAHLTEHMLSCGTRGFAYANEQELSTAIAKKQWYFDMGTTDFDHSFYAVTAPVHDIDEMMEFLNAFVRRPRLRSGIRQELKIIEAERLDRMESDQREGNRERYMAIYADPHFASVPSWSDTAPLDDMTLDDVREFHAKWYDCPNMTLIGIGGIDEDKAFEVIDRRFPVRNKDYVVPPHPHKVRLRKPRPRTNIVRKKRGRPNAADIRCFWIVPPGQGDGLGLAIHGLKSVLTQELRNKRNTNYGIEIEIEYLRDHRVVTLTTSVAPEAAAATRRVIREALRDHEIIVGQIHHHRATYANNIRFNDLSIDSTLESALESLVATGAIRSHAWYAERLAHVAPDDLRKWFTEWLTPERAYTEVIES